MVILYFVCTNSCVAVRCCINYSELMMSNPQLFIPQLHILIVWNFGVINFAQVRFLFFFFLYLEKALLIKSRWAVRWYSILTLILSLTGFLGPLQRSEYCILLDEFWAIENCLFNSHDSKFYDWISDWSRNSWIHKSEEGQPISK